MSSITQRSGSISNLVYHAPVRVFIVTLCLISFLISLRILMWQEKRDYIEKHNAAILTMLDVGQGDGFAIDLPGGQKIIIDVGLSAEQFEESLFSGFKKSKEKINLEYILDPASLRKTLDFIFLTHDDADHAAALPTLSKDFKIGMVGVTPFAYSYLEKAAVHKSQIFNVLMRGMTIQFLNKNAATTSKISILFPDLGKIKNEKSSNTEFKNIRSTNEHSLIMKFEHASTSIVFTGDAGIAEENILLAASSSAEDLRSDILKVGHHGSKGSTGLSFLEKVHPYLALISNGIKNRYGHPHAETIKKIENIIPMQRIVRTDTCGTWKLLIFEKNVYKQMTCIK